MPKIPVCVFAMRNTALTMCVYGCIIACTNRKERMDEDYYTVDEVAERLKVSRATVYNWMRTGALSYVIVGSERRVTGSAIRAFVRPGKTEEDRGKSGNSIPALYTGV